MRTGVVRTGVVRTVVVRISTLGSVTAQPTPDDLVDAWLTLQDVADELGIDVGKVRRLLKEGRLAGVRRGDPPILSVPAGFLVPIDAFNPSADEYADEDTPVSRATVLASLQGTLSVLSDAGFSDADAIVWLYSEDDSLPGRPVDALRSGHNKTEVRRRAQAEL